VQESIITLEASEASAGILPEPEPNTSFPDGRRCEVPEEEPGPDVLLFVRWDIVSELPDEVNGFPSRRLPAPVKGLNFGSATSFNSSEFGKPPVLVQLKR
jgi:hypothetical protein